MKIKNMNPKFRAWNRKPSTGILTKLERVTDSLKYEALPDVWPHSLNHKLSLTLLISNSRNWLWHLKHAFYTIVYNVEYHYNVLGGFHDQHFQRFYKMFIETYCSSKQHGVFFFYSDWAVTRQGSEAACRVLGVVKGGGVDIICKLQYKMMRKFWNSTIVKWCLHSIKTTAISDTKRRAAV